MCYLAIARKMLIATGFTIPKVLFACSAASLLLGVAMHFDNKPIHFLSEGLLREAYSDELIFAAVAFCVASLFAAESPGQDSQDSAAAPSSSHEEKE